MDTLVTLSFSNWLTCVIFFFICFGHLNLLALLKYNIQRIWCDGNQPQVHKKKKTKQQKYNIFRERKFNMFANNGGYFFYIPIKWLYTYIFLFFCFFFYFFLLFYILCFAALRFQSELKYTFQFILFCWCFVIIKVYKIKHIYSENEQRIVVWCCFIIILEKFFVISLFLVTVISFSSILFYSFFCCFFSFHHQDDGVFFFSFLLTLALINICSFCFANGFFISSSTIL